LNSSRNGVSACQLTGASNQFQIRFRNAKPAPGTHGPLIPGDPEREAEAVRSKEGIPLIKPVVDDLLEISRKTGIPFEVKRE
jgi:LDH2 family malate/lactate/ureidoglycolate dehydrogenase